VGAAAGVLLLLLFASFSAAAIAGLVFWILKLVEVVGIPEHQYQAAGTDKLTWTLVVVLAGAIGALVWHFAKRTEVLQAAGRLPAAPPGWYPEAGTSGLRWWDGSRWTEHRNGPPTPPPAPT
jgi:endo-1,4-beta-mannosidase